MFRKLDAYCELEEVVVSDEICCDDSKVAFAMVES